MTKNEAKKAAGINTDVDIRDADKAIKMNISSQLPIYLILIILFLILRKKLNLLYTPNPRKRKMHPAYNHMGLLNWIIPLYKTTDIQIININELDSYVMLSLFKMIATILFFMVLLVTLPLIFVYTFRKFDKKEIYYSMCNKNRDTFDYRLAAFIACILATIIILGVLYRYARSFISLRQAYIRNPATMHPIVDMKKYTIDYINAPLRVFFLRVYPVVWRVTMTCQRM